MKHDARTPEPDTSAPESKPAPFWKKELPEEEFVDPACGTNGGPPGLRIGSFDEFQRCRAESSGLREIWFRYDDEDEYIARAARDPDAVARTNAMLVLGQPVALSLLVDQAGLMQGYRIFRVLQRVYSQILCFNFIIER